ALLRGGEQIPDILLRVEPIGSRRLPNLNLLSVRVEKRFGLPGGQDILLRTNVFNAFNTTIATEINAQSGTNFGVVTERVLPRIVDFQLQYRF
ncbi:MAG: hypothetical protein ACRD2X_19490, partial [Vicinamibacteraceae bacterium]